MTQNRSVFQPIKHLFSNALSIYTVYVFNFENVVISYVSYVCKCVNSPICTGPWFPMHLYNYRTVLVHVHRTRGGLDHFTTCKLTIDV